MDGLQQAAFVIRHAPAVKEALGPVDIGLKRWRLPQVEWIHWLHVWVHRKPFSQSGRMHAQAEVAKVLRELQGCCASTKVAVDEDGGSPWCMQPLGIHRWLCIG